VKSLDHNPAVTLRVYGQRLRRRPGLHWWCTAGPTKWQRRV